MGAFEPGYICHKSGELAGRIEAVREEGIRRLDGITV